MQTFEIVSFALELYQISLKDQVEVLARNLNYVELLDLGQHFQKSAL
jgi:hypothetical protein